MNLPHPLFLLPRYWRKTSVVRASALIAGLSMVLLAGCGGTSAASSTTTHSTASPVSGTPTPSVIFHDPLTSNVNGWTDDPTHCAFESDGLHIKGGYLCQAPSDSLGDAIATVTTQQISGDNVYFYGMYFRHASTGNYYLFEIDSNGKWICQKVVSGQATDVVPYVANAAIHAGLNQTNLLQVRAVGAAYTFWVNGTQVGQATDTTFTKGNWGLVGNDNIEAVFTNYALAQP